MPPPALDDSLARALGRRRRAGWLGAARAMCGILGPRSVGSGGRQQLPRDGRSAGSPRSDGESSTQPGRGALGSSARELPNTAALAARAGSTGCPANGGAATRHRPCSGQLDSWTAGGAHSSQLILQLDLHPAPGQVHWPLPLRLPRLLVVEVGPLQLLAVLLHLRRRGKGGGAAGLGRGSGAACAAPGGAGGARVRAGGLRAGGRAGRRSPGPAGRGESAAHGRAAAAAAARCACTMCACTAAGDQVQLCCCCCALLPAPGGSARRRSPAAARSAGRCHPWPAAQKQRPAPGSSRPAARAAHPDELVGVRVLVHLLALRRDPVPVPAGRNAAGCRHPRLAAAPVACWLTRWQGRAGGVAQQQQKEPPHLYPRSSSNGVLPGSSHCTWPVTSFQ
jgi:hypothetical protein